MSSTHTATPWYVVDNEKYLEIVVPWSDRPEVVDRYCPTIASVQYEGNQQADGRANAAFIVKAVNSHDQLVALLKKARRLADIAAQWHLDEVEIDGEMIATTSLYDEFHAALAAAEA